MRKSRILVVVTSQIFVRNYFKTDALADLEEAYDCHFLIADNLVDAGPITGRAGRRITTYHPDRAGEKRQYKIYKVFMWRYRKRSSTFRFRIERIFHPKAPYRPASMRNLGHNAMAWFNRVGIAYRKARLAVLAADPVFGLYRKLRVDRLKPSSSLAEAMAGIEADLVLMPSSAFDPDANDVLMLARAKGQRCVVVVDNWDNLSSKSVMWLKPDHLGVWGEQSREHAERIHGFRPDQVTLLGTPRFDDYFRRRREALPSYFDHPYILFLGTSLAFDEASALQKLDGILERNQDRFAGVKVVYRPHPWREGKDSIVGMNLKYVVLDPQLAERHLRDERGIQFQPDLGYYPALLKNAEVVVGGLTSMLIEATIFGKDYVALTYDDGKNVTNQRAVLEKSEHFRGVERISSVSFCRVPEDVERLLVRAWDRRGERTLEEIDVGRLYILYSDERPYRIRLRDLVESQLVTAGRP